MSWSRFYDKRIITLTILSVLLLTNLRYCIQVSALYNNSQSSEYIWEQLQYDLESSSMKLFDIDFINATHGWIVGEDTTGVYGGIVLNSNDGGSSWHLQLHNYSPYHEQIDILDAQMIWVTGEGALYYSFDGGKNWNESVVSESSGMSFVKFINVTHGWTATMGKLYATENCGQSWQEVPGWIFSDDVPREIHFISSMKVWAIGYFGIYLSQDGCKTWTCEFDKGGWAFSFIDELEGWAVSDNMLAHITDGQKWRESSLPTGSSFSSPYFTDIQFIDSNTGWIVGGSPTMPHVIYTPNGGQTWYEQSSPVESTERLMAVDFFNKTLGWAVGSDGTIIRTTKGNSLGTILGSSKIISTLILVFGIGVVVVISGVQYMRRKKRKPDIGVMQ